MSFAKKNRGFGDLGEDRALEFLLGKGLLFVDRNFHAQGGEVDLIMLDKKEGVYVLVEVKARRVGCFDGGFESITPGKVRKILLAGRDFFFKKLGFSELPDFRVDAVILEMDGGGGVLRVEHLVHL